ncbi:MAG: FAD-dependent urate hydroxylase HpxO [Nodosilinea sp. LVE1205-7]|jgi:FAD-dependent urate hydroxylase
MYNLKVVIIGAGIGGLTAAIAMEQAGYRVEVYDRVQQLRPVGAGISLWSNGVKVLNRLGLGDQLATIGGSMNTMEYRSHRDQSLSYIDLQPLFEQVGQRPYPVARADLQAILLKACGPDRLQLGMTCVAIDQDAHSATAIFANGHRATGDLVIVADGARSTLRNQILEQPVERRYAGYVNWNGLVPATADLCPRDRWVIYVGDSKRASMMPVGGDRFYFFFGAPMVAGTQVSPGNLRQELAQLFQGWPLAVERLIQRLDPETTNRLDISDLDPLESWVKGRIALLGDAAHASTPTLGQGGCQALEDVEVLSRYLLTTNIGVADALQRYQQARQDRTAQLVLKARKRAATIYGHDPVITQQWYVDLSQEPPAAVIKALATTILAGPLG